MSIHEFGHKRKKSALDRFPNLIRQGVASAEVEKRGHAGFVEVERRGFGAGGNVAEPDHNPGAFADDLTAFFCTGRFERIDPYRRS